MLNFLADVFLRTILQSWFNENVWNLYIQKECVGLTDNQKDWCIWNIKFLKYAFWLYLIGISVFCTMHTLSPMFSGIKSNNLFLFCLQDIEKML